MTQAPPHRLADMLIAQPARHPSGVKLRDSVRAAQKFYVEMEHLHDLLAHHKDTLIEYCNRMGARDAFRLPFRQTWLEIAFPVDHECLPNDLLPSDAFYYSALFLDADESFQRGEAYHFLCTNVVRPNELQIGEIKTRFDLSVLDPDLKQEPFLPGEPIQQISDAMNATQVRNAWRKQVDNNEWRGLLGFLMALTLPKTLIEKEDLSAYNRTQRRLYRHNRQRQEFHHVRISMDDRNILYTGGDREGHHTPHGEHEVRGFYRRLRSGRVSFVRPHRRGSGPTRSVRLGYKVVPASTIL